MACFGDGGFEGEEVVVAGGAFVGDVEVDDREKYVHGFEVAVTEVLFGFAEEFGSSHFEPDGVGGVVGDAHGITFGIADSEGEGSGRGIRV